MIVACSGPDIRRRVLQTRSRSAGCPPVQFSLPSFKMSDRSLFAVLGIFVGVWGAHIPSVKAHYGLDEAKLAGVLLSGALGAVFMLLFAGRVVARLGTRRATLFAGLLSSLAFSLALRMQGLAGLVLLFFSLGAGTSLLRLIGGQERAVGGRRRAGLRLSEHLAFCRGARIAAHQLRPPPSGDAGRHADADRGQDTRGERLRHRKADAGGGIAEFDIRSRARRTGSDLLNGTGDHVVPQRQCEFGAGLLRCIQGREPALTGIGRHCADHGREGVGNNRA